MQKKFLILLFTILLSSCSKPHVQYENIVYPESTRSGIKYTPLAGDLSKIAWWKRLKDRELDELLQEALACNDKLTSSYATIEEAQAQLKSAQYAWIPTLDASANSITARTSNARLTPEGRLAHNVLFSDFTNLKFRGYYTGFVPSYTLNILSNIANIKSAKASLAVYEAEAQSMKLSIISQMSGTYFMLLSQRAQLAAQKSLAMDLKKLRRLEEVRFHKGASDIEMLISLDQQLSQEDAKIPQIESIIMQSENTIRLLLNKNPGPIPTKKTLLSENIKQLIPKALPSTVIQNRPDIMIARSNVRISEAQLGLAYSAFFPSFTLTGLTGRTSIDLANLLKLSANLWVAEAFASTKILNASSYQNVKAARANLKAIYYDYLYTLRQAFVDVDTKLSSQQKNYLSFLEIEKVFRASQRAYNISLEQFKAGAKDKRTLINAKINLDRSLLNLVQQKAAVLDSMVQVYTAVAGGYAANLESLDGKS